MATEIFELAKEGVSFLLSVNDDEKLESSEISSSLDKVVKDVSDFIKLRTDIYLQKEEKIQQYQQDQLRKFEAEEQYYVNKCKEIEINLSDYAKQLREVEESYSDISKKIKEAEELNIKLKDEVSNMATEKDDLKERYRRTNSLYSMVIQWYEKYLNIHIDISKEDPLEITFYFGSERSKFTPYVKFEVIDDLKFKMLDMCADLESDKENFQEFYTTREVISFIHDSQKKLKTRR